MSGYPHRSSVDTAATLVPFFDALGRDHTLDQWFGDLGDDIDRRWKSCQYDESQLASVATAVLSAAEVPSELSAHTVAANACLRPLVPQGDRRALFGEPPITVYVNERFNLAVLFWLDGTPLIHDHAFSGAFKVLAGSSIHSRFVFEPHWDVSRRLRFGDVRLADTEVLQRGDTRPIPTADAGTHSLFHLERPSLTLVARSNHEPWSQPQLSYWRPGIAFDPFDTPPTLQRRLQVLRSMRAIDEIAAVALTELVLVEADLHSALLVIYDLVTSAAAPDVVDHLVERLCSRHDRLTGYLPAAIENRRRELALIRLRGALTEERHRLLLALVLNLPDAAACASLVDALFPGRRPGELLAELIAEIDTPELRDRGVLTVAADVLAHVQTLLRSADDDTDLAALLHRVLTTV